MNENWKINVFISRCPVVSSWTNFSMLMYGNNDTQMRDGIRRYRSNPSSSASSYKSSPMPITVIERPTTEWTPKHMKIQFVFVSDRRTRSRKLRSHCCGERPSIIRPLLDMISPLAEVILASQTGFPVVRSVIRRAII